MWKIQKYRMSKKMTQETLAEAIDVTPSYVSEIENSKKRPSLKTLQKIADVLGVPLVALMDDGPEVEQKKDVFVQCPFISYMDSPSALAEVSGITKEIFSVVTELPVEEKIKVLSYARDLKKKDYKIWALITNDFNPELTHKWLNDEKAKAYIIRQMVFYAQRYPIDGYNFDFENIYDSDKDALSRFVEEATGELHKQGITVSMDITVASDTANWSSCYDRAVLGKTVDYLVLMAYDEHGRLSKTAGSVASINWVENGVKNLIAQVPPEKANGYPSLSCTVISRLTNRMSWERIKAVSSSSPSYPLSGNFRVMKRSPAAAKLPLFFKLTPPLSCVYLSNLTH